MSGPVAVKTADGPRLVGPDNGLLSLAWKALGGVTMAVEIDATADLLRAGFDVGSMVEVATTPTSIRARRIVAYSDVRPGEYGMLVDAWDRVSVIRYEASAAAGMGVTRGDPVWIATAQ